ncbi:MAG TPA: rhomboid family intramembrane serine protease [Kofleriaceae bacterium]|nr:rhomboid family intramembrane serine protease [Kofleriaceae bacterium]
MIPIRDDLRTRRAPVVTWTIIALNALVFFYELSLSPRALEELFFLHGLVPARISNPEWAAEVGFPPGGLLTFVTSTFLHGGWLHILSNMWILWIFGDNVEDEMGRFRFLAFYLICGAVAGAVHWFANPVSIVPTVGASGAIAGVLGGYFLMHPRAQVLTLFPIIFIPLFFWMPAVLFLLIWFVTQLVQGSASGLATDAVGGVAWWAHVGGFVCGAVLHRLFLARDHVLARSVRERW